MSMSHNVDWKSVRPVRFRSQIFGAVDYVLAKEKVTVSELAQYALKLRNQREEKRLQTLGRTKSIGPRTKDPRRQPYLTKTQQLVRVLRSTGFIILKDDIVSGTELAEKLLDKRRKDEICADSFFLQRLLSSRFVTYWLYLKQLFESREVIIPREFSKRDANLRNYLRTQKFPVSVWSFYIMRDLFYDFALLNYIIEEREERIFPLYSLNRTERDNYIAKIKSPDGYIYYWKKVAISEFEDSLIQAYLEIEGAWDRMAGMIELRERVSEMLHISERQFNLLLKKVLTDSTEAGIYASVGELTSEKRRGYMTKVVSLPVSNRGYPLTLIRISRKGV